MKKEYDTFTSSLEELVEGQEVPLTVRELAPGAHKYSHRYVKAILSRSPGRLPEADVLWIRSRSGVLHPDPWAIKIIGELEIPRKS